MELLRRLSSTHDVDEQEIRRLSQLRRKSSYAVAAREEAPVVPNAIEPVIEVFPGSVSQRQETLLVTPNDTARGFLITFAENGQHVLTAATPSSPVPGTSHTKHFYGKLDSPRAPKDRKDSGEKFGGKESTKLCALTRDSISFRRRHHVDDPYNNRRLIEMEFSTSSWNANELKAEIELLNRYSDSASMEPIRLKWRGRRHSLEGVLEWKDRPVAVCADGDETEPGEYALYVAPGMDAYVCAIIVVAVDDRTRRGSNDGARSNSSSGKAGNDDNR